MDDRRNGMKTIGTKGLVLGWKFVGSFYDRKGTLNRKGSSLQHLFLVIPHHHQCYHHIEFVPTTVFRRELSFPSPNGTSTDSLTSSDSLTVHVSGVPPPTTVSCRSSRHTYRIIRLLSFSSLLHRPPLCMPLPET